MPTRNPKMPGKGSAFKDRIHAAMAATKPTTDLFYLERHLTRRSDPMDPLEDYYHSAQIERLLTPSVLYEDTDASRWFLEFCQNLLKKPCPK